MARDSNNPPLKFKCSFFSNLGVIFKYYLLMKPFVTEDVLKDALSMFLMNFKDKRPTKRTKEFLANKGTLYVHPPCFPGLVPVYFFYFPIIKKMFEDVEIVYKSVQKDWTESGGPLIKKGS
ncbi:Hypothetical protein FKW44_005370 [Caligus rogercresseyi]|uniref:Uncharacterized protein n=1 Tax=Caligus rogercresseyi TaxID=217165 RepID=A0A7T8KBV2_CALRO|nr:Hypothetical protein FKW44_005370 [Caligus rogercresseyi]